MKVKKNVDFADGEEKNDEPNRKRRAILAPAKLDTVRPKCLSALAHGKRDSQRPFYEDEGISHSRRFKIYERK